MADQSGHQIDPLERFLELYWADRNQATVRPVQDYLDLFPGFEDRIRAEFAALESLYRSPGSADAESGMERIGSYRVVRKIGQGGQGVVYMAEDVRLRRRVALKVLTGLGTAAPDALERFRREAAMASRLDHPGICGIYDTGVENGVPYISMRYVEGESLAQKIAVATQAANGLPQSTVIDLSEVEAPAKREADPATGSGGPTTWAEVMRVVALIEEAARALHAAHEAMVIHRDIKPGNIMCTPEGRAVILDFGLARELESEVASLTRTGEFFGTPAYMSPEQIAAQRIPLDRRTDVYSLGVTLYECLTLRRPFEAPTRAALYQAILTKDPPNPRRLNPNLPSDLKVVIETALEKDRDRRYQTALDLAEDLRRVRSFEPIAARPAGPALRLRRWAQRNPALATALTVVFLALSTGLAVALHYLDVAEAARHREEVAQGERSAAVAAEAAARRRADILTYVANIRQARLHLDEDQVEDAVRLLDACPESMRGWEWHRLKLECDSSTFVCDNKGVSVTAVAFSSGGAWLASGDADGRVRVWDAETGVHVRDMPSAHETRVTMLVFSPDGTMLGSLDSEGKARIWAMRTGECLNELAGESSRQGSERHTWIEFSSDSQTVLSLNSSGIRFWPVGGGGAPTAGESGIFLAASPTGKGTWEVLEVLGGGSELIVRGIDQSGVAGPSSSSIHSRKEQAAPLPTDTPVESLVRTPTNILRIDDVTLRGGSVTSFSSDGLGQWIVRYPDRFVFYPKDSTGIRWKCEWSKPGISCAVPGHIPDSLAFGTGNGAITLTNLESSTERTLHGHRKPVLTLAFSRDDRALASGSEDGTIRVWAAAHPQADAVLRHKLRAPWASDPRGREFVLGQDSWDPVSGVEVPLMLFGERFEAVAYAPSGEVVAGSGYPGDVEVFDANSGVCLSRFQTEGVGSKEMSFDSTGEFLGVSFADGSVHVWRWRGAPACVGTVRVEFPGGRPPPFALGPDGSRIVVVDPAKPLSLREVATGLVSVEFPGTGKGVRTVALTAAGDRLASAGDDGRIDIWEVSSGTHHATLRGHALPVRDVAFSPVGPFRLASGSDDGTVRIWEFEHGHELLTLHEHAGSVRSVSFTRDGRALFAADHLEIVGWQVESARTRMDLSAEAHCRHHRIEEWMRTRLRRHVFRDLAMKAAETEFAAEPGRLTELRNSVTKQWVDPEWNDVLADCWELLLGNFEPAHALHLAEALVAVSPGNPEAEGTLAAAYHRQGRFAECLDALDRARDLAPDRTNTDEETAFRAMAHARLGRRDEAVEWLGRLYDWLLEDGQGDLEFSYIVEELDREVLGAEAVRVRELLERSVSESKDAALVIRRVRERADLPPALRAMAIRKAAIRSLEDPAQLDGDAWRIVLERTAPREDRDLAAAWSAAAFKQLRLPRFGLTRAGALFRLGRHDEAAAQLDQVGLGAIPAGANANITDLALRALIEHALGHGVAAREILDPVLQELGRPRWNVGREDRFPPLLGEALDAIHGPSAGEAWRLLTSLHHETPDSAVVTTRIRESPGISESVRAAAMALASAMTDDPVTVSQAAYLSLTGSERRSEGETENVRALSWAASAARRVPGNPVFEVVLGIAQYRNGLLREAAECLNRATGRLEATDASMRVSGLSFLAMARHRLGESGAEVQVIEKLREALRSFQSDLDVQSLSAYAEWQALSDASTKEDGR